MEIFGGFMVMSSIIGLFLAAVWLVMPFAVLSVKGKMDQLLERFDALEQHLAALNGRVASLQQELKSCHGSTPPSPEDGRPAVSGTLPPLA